MPFSGNSDQELGDPTWTDHTDGPVIQSRHQALEALKSSRQIQERFWTLFHREYLTSLREKHQRTLRQERTKATELKEQMFVLLCDEMQPKQNWTIARIEELCNSEDGAIRNAKLHLGDGRTIVRPINLLVPLELDEEETDEVQNTASEEAIENEPAPELAQASLESTEPPEIVTDPPAISLQANGTTETSSRRGTHRYGLRDRKRVNYPE
ncbi:hypothetical protein QR680_017413 [Steinernema hermaphroditum]|uniref:DUF5641 domain-containing protein n=1 Tax=Steinernema hermaphroditum TaxID=289476 RepID=A0AA39HGM1_9BILA|nr:hypothetical protein QR680_017413 [Steinernema hermaphroditum]